jgi:hypothetical protein
MIDLDLKKIFVLILILATGSITYILICRNIFNKLEHQYSEALNDYTMLPNNQKIVNKVELGEEKKKPFKGLNYKLKNSALEIACTDRGNILLVFKSDLDENFKYMTSNKKASFFASFRMENGLPKGEAEIREMNYVDSKFLNTMVSNSLSKQEVDDIIKALEERNSDLSIGIGLAETGFGLNGNVKTSDVKRLNVNCKKNN